MSDDWLTIEEAADEYGVPPSTLRRWCAKGYATAKKRGKQWFIDPFWLGNTMTPAKRYKSQVVLRRQIKALIEKYSDDSYAWLDDVFYLERDSVVADLKEILNG